MAAPFSATGLPLNVQAWQDDRGAAWMSYPGPGRLAARHGLTAGQAAPLAGRRSAHQQGGSRADGAGG